jgi:hypothetical protein
MTGADVAAMITAAGGAFGVIAAGIALLRKRSGELHRTEQSDLEECSAWRRAALRVIRKLRDRLSEAGIPEPEGIDDELGIRRSVTAASEDTS